MKLALGQTMRDAVSGFTGIAFQLVQFQNGNIQFALQPKLMEGENTMPVPVYLDVLQLDYVDQGVSARVTPVTEKVKIKLGDGVVDMASGLEGIAIRQVTFMNGCVYFDVQPQKRNDNAVFDGMPEVVFLEHKRLDVVRKKAFVMDAIKSAIGGKAPGGPMRAVARQKVSAR